MPKKTLKKGLIFIVIIAIISFTDYFNSYISNFGKTEFYLPIAHFYNFMMWFLSIITTLFISKNKSRWILKKWNGYVQITLVILVVNMLITGLIFIGMRLITSWIYGGGTTSISTVLLTLLDRTLAIHIPVIACITAYNYLQEKRILKERLAEEKEANALAQIRTLKQQIAPHFLFNNLNVLSSLIYEDKHEADTFLNRFANLYRYVLQYDDEDFVSMSTELNHIEDYMYLLNHRFNNAYSLEIKGENRLRKTRYILPNTLQLLIENVVKYNVGSVKNPLKINIAFSPEEITIKNTLIPKMESVNSNKIGLENLKKRYDLAVNKDVIIQRTEREFIVSIPLIKKASI